MGTPSACPDSQSLERFLLGLIQGAAADVLETHLEQCAACSARVVALRAEDPLVEAITNTPQPMVGPDQDPILHGLVRQLKFLSPPPHEPHKGVPRLDTDLPPAVADVLAPPADAGELGRLGPYDLVKVLGRGGMGTVFQARQRRPQRVVAVKMIEAGRRTDPARLARFRSEAEVIGRLQHPHIVQVFEAGEQDGLPYYAMEYVSGGTLAQRLAAAPLAARDAAQLVETLARAMDAAHERGFIHRDLKPSNVLLGADGTPKISDFGLAKHLAGDGAFGGAGPPTESGTVLGTPAYMAPEQTTGHNAGVGPAADVYALGAILYECLTGRPPFRAATVLETLEQVRAQEPVPPGRLQPGVPRDLQTLCLKCLAKEPRRRYDSARALADDLGRFLRHEPIRARPVGTLERVWKWARRRPAVAGLLAVTGLALVALVAGALVYHALLRDAIDEARSREVEVRTQEQRAARNYRLARDTLNQMLHRLDARPLATVPRLKELRQQQLEDALAFYQQVVKGEDHADPAVGADTAVAYEQAATIQYALGRGQAAAENFQRALALLEGLPAELREQSDQLARLVHCHNHLAYLGPVDDRGRQLQQSQTICARMAAAHPGDAQWQNHLARSHHNLAQMYYVAHRLGEAEGHYRRAIELRAALVRDFPAVELYRAELAGTYQNEGLRLGSTNRRAQAAAMFARAEKLLTPLIAAHPEVGEYALTLASTCINWGNTLRDTGKPRDALAVHTRAVELAEAVLRNEPRDEGARHMALIAHGTRAQDYEGLGRYADAVKDWDSVVAYAPDAGRSRYRVSRAVALARAGSHDRAATEARGLATEPDVAGDALYSVACAYALSAGRARSDAGVPLAVRTRAAEQHAAAAVALLERLRAAGYFARPQDAAGLVLDWDLAALWARPDFQALCRAAGARKNAAPAGESKKGP